MLLPVTALTEYGWSRADGRLSVVWEAPENIRKAKAQMEFVLGGCKCKTGCGTLRCGCKKQDRHCGPGCHCINCTNGTHLRSERVTELEVDDIIQEHQQEDLYIADDSDDDLADLLRDDDGEELEEVIENDSGDDSD